MPFRLSTAGLLVVVGALFGAFISQSPKWLRSMVSDDGVVSHREQKALGLVQEISGGVSRKPFGHRSGSLLIKANSTLHHLDTLEIAAKSYARIQFDSGFELEVSGPALLVVTLWDPELTASPVLVQLSTGEARLLKEGERGQLFVIHGGRWINPKTIADIELRTLPLGLRVRHLTPPAEPTSASEPSEASTEPVRSGALPSNDEIDAAVARWAQDFQKCQSNAIREKTESRGKMMVALTITPNGEVKNPRVVSSDIKDETLKSCVIQVFERIKLRPFEGSPIERTYPLAFE